MQSFAWKHNAHDRAGGRRDGRECHQACCGGIVDSQVHDRVVTARLDEVDSGAQRAVLPQQDVLRTDAVPGRGGGAVRRIAGIPLTRSSSR
jgi:hypothetical protein